MTTFTPFSALAGGALLGLAASAMLLFNGRILGISGIFGGLLKPSAGDALWRLVFVAGLLAGGATVAVVLPDAIAAPSGRSTFAVVLAGLLVGFGTRMGSGCTSGHGICGLTRFSPRSMVATGSFMLAGGIAAATVRHVFGGAL